MTELDHLAIDISGRNLIEASAGTGKTFAIACLYLRLVIESGLTPDRILVVTYTEAATEELRGRIRVRLREALEVLDGTPTDDDILRGIVENRNGCSPDPAEVRRRLVRALTSFDLSAIFTIHGFCLRALQDHAFESGSLYDTELVTDPKPLLREVVDDFWRKQFFGGPAPLLDYALASGLTPDRLFEFLKQVVGNPALEVIPSFTAEEIAALDRAVQDAFTAVAAGWSARRGAITALVEEDKGLSRSKEYYRRDLLPGLFAGMDDYVAGGNPYAPFPGLERFTSSGIIEGTKNTGTAPADPFFDRCETLVAAMEQRLLALKGELVAFARQRLPERKGEANIRFFDDLLADLWNALRREGGTALAKQLRETYRAALIDEFQDTDPVQYAIFRAIYDDPDQPLFLIGDPKQAIYSFRGADIFAYLGAAADVDDGHRYTLTGNWRSSPRLLTAFNRLFRNDGRPFVFDEIAYHPVHAGNPGTDALFHLEGGDDAPLQVWSVAGEGGGGMTIGEANRTIPAAVAAEVSRLLQAGREGAARIDGRGVLPEDMAVIVRDKWQAGSVQEALRGLGIPSVMRSDRSIFDTDEARELCILLAALAEPGSEPRVRAALVTDLLGRSGDDIAALNDDEEQWEGCLQRFRDGHQTWLQRGFMVMAQEVVAREGIRGRLLGRPDGERRLTNLLHCLEVIHQAAHERRLGVEGLVTWFSQRVGSGENGEEHQIRLETDEKAVKIVTVHVSKGLEYPVVFCPFLWGGQKGLDGDVVSCHRGYSPIRDFGSPDRERHRVRAGKESLAESLRLLYVALTRAKYRCYLVGGKFRTSGKGAPPETSPLAYLCHAPEAARCADDPVTALKRELAPLTASQLEEQWSGLAATAEGTMAVLPLPDAAVALRYEAAPDDGALLRCLPFTGAIDRSWRVASFTTLSAHETPAPEAPDRDRTGAETDAVAEPPPDMPPGRNIFTFPKGARAGIVLHEVFQKLDFAAASPERIAGVVAETLRQHAFAAEWRDPVSAMVAKVLAAPLGTPDAPFTLADLRPGSWFPELEFFFPLKFITADLLRDRLARWLPGEGDVDLSALGRRLNFTPMKGMVRGFMDLVMEQGGRFYLVDWKSNHLGHRVEAYDQPALKVEMERHLYPLQYLLYTVALNRYLEVRVPGYDYETCFGGVRYLFLRGIDQAQGNYGIFRDRPPAGLVRELTAYLMEAGG